MEKMKKIISIFVSAIVLTILLVSCDSGQSLQKYYVDSESNDNFISLDIPASIINLKEGVSEEDQETLKTLKKLNVLAFKIDDENKDEYLVENKKIKEILENKNFNELMRGKHEGINFIVKYLGDDDEMDEVILYASDNSKGFVVARVLGDGMKPAKIMKLLKSMENFDKDNSAFEQIGSLFGDMN